MVLAICTECLLVYDRSNSMVGQTIAHYRIVEKIGEGGMGIVYKAADTRLHRTVAVKVLTTESVADPARRQRFILEAQAASALDHPGIIGIYDIPEVEGRHLIVMQYMPGKTLRQLLRHGRLAVDDAVRYALQISDALAQAHSRKIIHRDLKPENVMVTASGPSGWKGRRSSQKENPTPSITSTSLAFNLRAEPSVRRS